MLLQMEELLCLMTNLVVRQYTNVIVVMNLKEYLLEPVAVVDSGQMKHQPVNVRSKLLVIALAHILYMFYNYSVTDCGDPPSISHGEVTFSSTTFGSTAIYSCNVGYELDEESTLTCEAGGQWSGTVPECRVVPPTTVPPTTTEAPSGMYGFHYSLPDVQLSCDNYIILLCNICTLRTGNNLQFELNGLVYANGSTINMEDVGEGDNALLCRTDRTDCCTGGNRYGEFYYPDGSLVDIKDANGLMYRNRGPQLIRLNRNTNSLSSIPTGSYRCEIPNSNGVFQHIIINIIGTVGK